MRRASKSPGFGQVFWREVHWLGRRRFLLCLATLAPIALIALLTAVFSQGLATRLPVAVLDLDGSELSRSIVRMVDATPDAAVVEHASDLTEGRSLLLAGKVRGLLMLPHDLQRDVFAGHRPEVVFFYNTQTMTSGNLVVRGINNAVPTAEAGIRLSLRTSRGEPMDIAQADLQPIPIQLNTLFNPTLNYVFFLLASLVPSILQIVIVTTSSYSVGLDAETRHRFRVLRRMGGGLWPAIAGKQLPYTILFMMVLLLSDTVLVSWFGLPLNGSVWLLALAGLLFVLACQFIGTLLALLVRPMASACSMGALLTSPAFGFMGIGFPRLGMDAFAYWFGSLLPGTWYLQARIDQTVRGTPIDLSWTPILILLAFVVALAGLTALQLGNLRRRTQRAREQEKLSRLETSEAAAT